MINILVSILGVCYFWIALDTYCNVSKQVGLGLVIFAIGTVILLWR